jgi:hypothetical protein
MGETTIGHAQNKWVLSGVNPSQNRHMNLGESSQCIPIMENASFVSSKPSTGSKKVNFYTERKMR